MSAIHKFLAYDHECYAHMSRLEGRACVGVRVYTHIIEMLVML